MTKPLNPVRPAPTKDRSKDTKDARMTDDEPLELLGDEDPGDVVADHHFAADDELIALDIRGAIARDLLREDGFGHVGELWDAEYEDDRKRPTTTVREVCALCAGSIPLPRPWRHCEFPEHPYFWRQGDQWVYCHCNGCLVPSAGSMGRPLYCSDKCRHRMKLAWERGRRRADGAKSWSSDAEADRIVKYRMDFRALVAERRATARYPRL